MSLFNILIVDDNIAIQSDFKKIFQVNSNEEQALSDSIDSMEQMLFNKEIKAVDPIMYNLSFASQGQDALNLVNASLSNNMPFSIAFIDIRMPPGWDGIETIERLWEVDPNIQMVICTAYSDYSWDQIKVKFKHTDKLLILKKPFDNIEAQQLATSLTTKWQLHKETEQYLHHMDALVLEKTRQLQAELETTTQLKEDLHRSFSLINSTLEATDAGILVVDLNKNIIKTNHRFHEMFNFVIHTPATGPLDLALSLIAPLVKSKGGVPTECIYQYFNNCKNSECAHELLLCDGRIIEVRSHPKLLEGKIDGQVFTFSNITLRRSLEEKIVYQATHDMLTDLPNRLLLTDRLSQEILKSKRDKSLVALCCFSLDNFKFINENLGSTIGDNLLKQVAFRLKKEMREGDTIARLGDDEFSVVIPQLDSKKDANDYVSRVLSIFKASYNIDNREFHITVSMGVSLCPIDSITAEDLIKNASAAMSLARTSKSNTAEFYTENMHEIIMQQLELEQGLYHGLEKNQFSLNYQPIISTHDKHVVLLEALVRWNVPDLGVISPVIFIPIAERTGIIHALGEWIIWTACRQLKYWNDNCHPHLKMAINLSSYQLMDDRILSILAAVLKETGINPSNIEFELTESVLLVGTDKIKTIMQEIIDLGFSLTLDDFGTGFCSLTYLKEFPIKKLKIDRSFISSMNTIQTNFDIVCSVLSMAHNLNLEVVAEGVETIQELALLETHGCDLLQGFYFSKPLNASELNDYFAQHQICSKDTKGIIRPFDQEAPH